MRAFFFTLAQALGLILLADFVAGLVHWLEDAYGDENTPFFGSRIIKANIVHHHVPRHFTRLSWWDSSADLLLIGLLLIAAGWWWGFLSWQLWLFVVVSVNANQVHKWAHRTRAENGPIISWFQDARILQTPRHHSVHHTHPKNTYYCPITNMVNPVLERIQFWPRLETLIERVSGFRHRHDTSNPGQGPAPDWLAAYRSARKPTAPSVPSISVPRPTCDGATCPLRENCARANPALKRAA